MTGAGDGKFQKAATLRQCYNDSIPMPVWSRLSVRGMRSTTAPPRVAHPQPWLLLTSIDSPSMAEYTQITDPDLQVRVRTRYEREIASLRGLEFRHLAYCLETLGPFSAVYQLPVLLLTLPKKEVLAFPPPLRLAVACALLAHTEPPTIALCMGMGVKLYSSYMDGTILISSTFRSHAEPGPISPIVKSPAARNVQDAWAVHQGHVSALEGQGRAISRGISFNDYVAISHLEENGSQYL